MGIARNQCSRRRHWHQPFQGIVPIYMEGAGENVFLIERNVQEQLSQERLWPLRVTGIKDAVTTV